MRGEHFVKQELFLLAVGSSPHARGTLSLLHLHVHPRRIIPACAGNTVCNAEYNENWRDHPRMRGEHWIVRGRICTNPSPGEHPIATIALCVIP